MAYQRDGLDDAENATWFNIFSIRERSPFGHLNSANALLLQYLSWLPRMGQSASASAFHM